MRSYRQVPQPPLDEFVHDLWLYEDYEPSSYARERILPTGSIELVINLCEQELRIYDRGRLRCRRYSGAIVCGPYSRPFDTDVAEERSVMGVHFKPAGAFPFLGVTAEDLAETHIDLETVWGRSARELRQRLCEAGSPQLRFALLENALRSHVLGRLEHHWAVAATVKQLTQSGARPFIREIAGNLGISQRRLIRVFADEAGLTPKLFGRIQRFQRALAVASAENSDWSEVALGCGYFDQAHLINEFMEFSGFTPGEYLHQLTCLRRQGLQRKQNHVPLLQAA